MKLSLEWLGDYITFTEADPQKIASAITAHVAEVDEVEVQGALLNHCCVGKVLKIEKHPNADKLSLCDVLTDKGPKRVVCGGTNLRLGMRVAFAHVGATVRHSGELVILQNVKIRGEQSDGMICAAEELELTNLYPPKPEDGQKPIIDFGSGDENVGKPLGEVLGLNDTVFYIDNHAITHRADLFSHIGFAFECVAIGIAKWKKMPDFGAPKFGKDPLPFAMKLESKHLMPRYCSCMIHFDNLGETPGWMKQRLIAVGWRPINLPIDITNYVASEIGVPLHSFDADDIKGAVHMRPSKKGETIVTLDKQERALPDGALVLSDDEGIFDLLGIMGGLRSSTKPTTRHIYLHSASLDPVSIRNTVIATGHRTDAATVYEKRVPHITTQIGFYRAVQLFLDLVPGARTASVMESVGDNGSPKPIDLFVDRVVSILGVDISAKDITKILTDLAFTVSNKGKGVLAVTPPLHRLGDIRGEHDLIEEVARVYGYNRIEATLPEASIVPPKRDTRVAKLREALVDREYFELLPLSLVGPELLKKCRIDDAPCVKIANAIGHETSLMTPSTLPALLEHAGRNLLLFNELLRTFHVSQVFTGHGKDHAELGALITAKSKTDLKFDPFLILKQEITEACSRIGYDLTIDLSKNIPSYAYPGRTADILCDGTSVGALFEVHPEARVNFDLPARAAAVTLNLTALLALTPQETIFAELPSFPAITYDVTAAMDHGKSVGNLLVKIRESSKLLETVEVADLYGKDAGPYNLTLRCTYRAKDRTLTEEEAKKEFSKAESLTS